MNYVEYPSHLLRSDGAAIPKDTSNADYRVYLAWVAGGNVPVQALPDDSERINRLWSEADALAQHGLDDNGRARAIMWLLDPDCPSWRRERIAAVLKWMDAVWTAYKAAKADPAISALPSLPECPYTFADIASE